jgi:2-methylcitrate dehydratase PrpD
MALAALAPDSAYALSPGPLAPAVSAFMGRIVVRGEEELLGAGYPQAWAAHVTLATDSGRHEHTVTHVPGDPARPFGEAELRQKFIRVAAQVLSAEQAEAMFGTALDAVEHPREVLDAIEAIRSSAC